MKLEFSGQSFEKYSNIKFHEHVSSGSRGFPCGQPEVTKLIVNLINVPKEVSAGCTTAVGRNDSGSAEVYVTWVIICTSLLSRFNQFNSFDRQSHESV